MVNLPAALKELPMADECGWTFRCRRNSRATRTLPRISVANQLNVVSRVEVFDSR